MKKGLKITAIAVVVLLLLMFILPFAFRGKIESIVKSEGNKMLNAQFDFRSLDISLFRNFPKASITLSEFYLRGTGEFEKDTLVQAGEIIAAIDLFSLFGDKGYDVSKIQIDNTDIHAIVLPDGHTNWDIMKPDSTPNNTETENKNETSPFKIQLQRFVIKNMNITYDDRQAGMYADIRNLDVFCSGDLGSDRTTLQLEAESKATTYKMNGIPFLSNADIFAKMNVDADLVNNKYTLKENEFRLNAIKAAIDGWVALNNPSIEMDLKLNSNEVGFKEILSLVPAIYAKDFDGLKTEGTASLTANAKGSLQGDSIVPQFNMTMAVKNAMFHYPSLPAGVDQINILAEIKNPGGNIDLTTIRINPFNFRLAGNPFKLVADIRTPVTDPDFQAEAKGILNLSKIKEVYPLEDMQLNGTINADMQLSARLSYIEKEQYERVQASGTIGLTDMQLKIKDMPDVDIHKSLFTFTPKYLQLTETTINIGKNDLTVDSRFENYLGYILKGSTIKGTVNLQSNHLNLNDFITATSSNANETSKTGNSSVVETSPVDTATVSLIHVPDNIDFQMDANLKEVLFDKMSFTDMNGKLIVKDSKVDMKNLSMNTMGGGVVMNGYYSTANVNIPKMDAGFRLNDINFAQAYKDLDMVQQFAPIFENLKGNFSGNMNIQTDLDATMSPVLSTMQGNGNLSTKDLSLSGVKVIDQIADAVKKPELKEMKVKDMTLDFTIKDGRVATQPFDIKLGEYAMNLSGTTGLDQTIDYTGKIKLPASAGDFAKLTTLDLKIGGSFTSPKVSIDTKSMANQAVEAIADKAAGELGKKLGLDSTITTNKDSLKEKIKEKATEKALDFLKKKLH
ncbi:AsmA family protein [Oscillospiraceae bacterium N12]|jgi:hypothetical protein|uniref:AsmA family protein n=1 Tax=Jilunia laotingensis TaxID=2763675 RepID=A0A926F0T9_9BACT|nr:AsmA-like C-terminal region-containing protein [Jilunia laotingensis]MBC8591998.1 AsmA family protein [Jilunia laotingensis]